MFFLTVGGDGSQWPVLRLDFVFSHPHPIPAFSFSFLKTLHPLLFLPSLKVTATAMCEGQAHKSEAKHGMRTLNPSKAIESDPTPAPPAGEGDGCARPASSPGKLQGPV